MTRTAATFKTKANYSTSLPFNPPPLHSTTATTTTPSPVTLLKKNESTDHQGNHSAGTNATTLNLPRSSTKNSSSPPSTPSPPLQLLTPNFIQHTLHPTGTDSERRSRAPIFSLDIHPDNSRLVTGGNDHFVRLWNLSAVLTKGITKNDLLTKELFAGKRHDGAVMCVRWATKTGSLLASGADDGSLVIWKLEKKPSMFNSLFSGGNGERYQETLHFVKKLPSMDSDVIDLAWSYDNRFLASCSLDNSIVVWDGHSFERVARCMHHSFVKGLSFDPIGQFLVSQSDDGSAVLWDVSTWRQYKKIAHPFVKGAVAGFVRRPCWSPDADYLACVNAVSQGVHVAAVIPRNKWWEPRKCIHLVGHSAPVCVAKFSPIVFHDPKDPDQVIRILALGSNDRRISIWALKKNPLIILENIFQSDIMDLVWSPDGQVLLASAREGRVAGIHFPRLTFFGWTPMKPNTFLDLMKQRHQFDPTHVHVVDHKDIVTSTESLKPVFPTPQKITHTKDGRKRIQPTLIASLSISGLQSTQPPPKLFKMPSHGSENLPSPFGGRCGSPSPFSGSITSSKRSTSSPPFSCSSCSSCTYFAFSRLKPSDTSFCLPLPPTIDTSFLAPLEIPEVGHVNVLKQSNETVFQISFLNSFETLCKVTFPNSQGPVFTKFSMNSMYFAVGTHSIPPRLYVYKFEDSKAILWMDGLCLLAPLYQCSLYQQMYLSLLTCDGKVYVYDLSQRTLLLKSSIRHLLLTTSASTSTMLMPATTTSSSSAQPLLSSPSIELSLIPWRGESSWTLQFQVNQVVYTYHPGLQGFY